MNSEKPASAPAGKKTEARFTWLSRALPAFHCILIGLAFTLAIFRFFVTGERTDESCRTDRNLVY